MHHFNKTTHMFKYFAFEIKLSLSLHKQINMGLYLQNSIQIPAVLIAIVNNANDCYEYAYPQSYVLEQN